MKKFTLHRSYEGYDYDGTVTKNGIHELIKRCPHITHLSGYEHHYGYGQDWHAFTNADYTRGVLEILSNYGPQLKHFKCDLLSKEITNAIVGKCKNIESLDLDLSPEGKFALDGNIHPTIVSSAPLLASLENLRVLALDFYPPETELTNYAEIICELIKRCGIKLQIFHFSYLGTEVHKVMEAIGVNLRNLEELKLHVEFGKDQDTSRDTKQKDLQESVEYILEGCQKLTSLDLTFNGRDHELVLFINEIIYRQICYKQQHLRYLDADITEIATPTLLKLIQTLPYCQIQNSDTYRFIPKYER